MLKILIKRSKSELEDEAVIISKIRQELLSSDIAKIICDEYGFDTDIINGLSIAFKKDLEASAKTTESKIELNSALLEESFEIIMRYAIHELVHALQHIKNKNPNNNEEEYLDQADEVEAFQFQIAYHSDAIGKDSAESYVDELIEYHELADDIALDKKEELLKLT